VLVLERISGIKVDNIEALDAAGYDRHRIATHAARMVIKEVLEDGFFHADPHPGNFVVMPGEVIGAMDFGMVGHLSRRTQADLTRLYVAVVQMDEQDMVDQLVRMRVVGNDVDRGRLRQDLSRLIHKYHGLPLDAIRAQDVMQDATPIAFRHHLRVPSELWLLGKTLAMMEGVGLKLDPDFDFVAFSRPYVRRFVWRMALPQNIGPTLLKRAADWADLVDLFPQASFQLLTQATRGDLEVKLTHRGLDQALARLDRSASRISLSMLLAALIVGLALLIPAFGLAEQMGLATVLVIAGFTVASLLGLWLAFSIWRSRK
jgi:ubiquinone biosynthesis protein